MSDKDNFIQEKLVAYHEKPCSYWQRLPYRSDTGGVSPIMMEGLEKYTNHRINGMTPDRRAWRKQWLLDQNLSHREPVFVPELYYELNNPVKRFYRYPFEKLESFVTKLTGNAWFGGFVRSRLVKTLWSIAIVYGFTYYFMYNKRDWTRIGGLQVQTNKPIVYPGSPGYPFVSEKKLTEFYDMGFSKTPLFKSEEQIRAEYAKEQAAKKASR